MLLRMAGVVGKDPTPSGHIATHPILYQLKIYHYPIFKRTS